ncbi:MAG: hypothetical protein AAGB46_00770 [Verrucomicrobiota bacterium]
MPTRLLSLINTLILMSLFGQISKLWGGSSSGKEELQNAAQPTATFKNNVSSFWT